MDNESEFIAKCDPNFENVFPIFFDLKNVLLDIPRR
jgi:hypothetical protein